MVRIEQCKGYMQQEGQDPSVTVSSKPLTAVLMEIAEDLHKRITVCEMIGKLEE